MSCGKLIDIDKIDVKKVAEIKKSCLNYKMLSINDLKSGLFIVYEGIPFEILEIHHLHIGRGSASIQTKLKNLKTGQVLSRNFKPVDEFEEAEIEKKEVIYLYNHRGQFWFSKPNNSKNRFFLQEEELGETVKFLKTNTLVQALYFQGQIINIKLPIKIDFKVIEAPPAIRGNTAQGGNKIVKIETGAEISTPLFVKTGDVIKVNTQTGEYAQRMEKN